MRMAPRERGQRFVKPVAILQGLAAVTLAAAVATLCVSQGIRETERHEIQRAIGVSNLSSLRAPPIEVDSVRARLAPYRRMSVSGTYDHAHEVLIQGRDHLGEAGFHVVTPLRVSDGAFLVVRGWIPLASGGEVELAALHEPGTLRVEGFPLPTEVADTPGSEPSDVSAASWPLRVDVLQLNQLKQAFPYAIFHFAIHQSRRDDLPSSPLRLPEPRTEEASHQRKATAWYLAAVVVAGLPVAGLLVLRRRR